MNSQMKKMSKFSQIISLNGGKNGFLSRQQVLKRSLDSNRKSSFLTQQADTMDYDYIEIGDENSFLPEIDDNSSIEEDLDDLDSLALNNEETIKLAYVLIGLQNIEIPDDCLCSTKSNVYVYDIQGNSSFY